MKKEFKPYPKYRDSGTTWLGRIPDRWPTKRIGQVFRERSETVSDSEYLPLSVTKNGIVPQMDSVAKTDSGEKRKKICKGDFAINSRSDRKGSSGLSPLDGSTSAITIVLEPTGINGAFAHHLLRCYGFQEEFYRWGKGIVADLWSTRFSEMRNIVIPTPDPDEATQIANFLDVETAKIDEAIRELEDSVELLADNRRSLISDLVVNGSGGARKDRTPHWFGNPPKHWPIVPLKRISKIGNGSTPSRENRTYWEGGTYPWLNSSTVNREAVTQSDEFVTSAALAQCHLPRISPPAVLVGITGQGRTRGMATTLLIEATINQHVAYLKPLDDRVSVTYLRRVLDSAYEYLRYQSEGVGGTKAAITCEMLGNLRIPLPSLDEQAVIEKNIGAGLKQLAEVALEKQSLISSLQEYRTTLIYEAVTGKIDLRDA